MFANSGKRMSMKNLTNANIHYLYVCLDGKTMRTLIFRLDFETFTILGPADTLETNGGACVDTFDVTVIKLSR